MTIRTQSRVFPAPAGINRCDGVTAFGAVGVPRASGDKPYSLAHIKRYRGCSPRQRG
ncbi:hypothetical protein HCV13_003616 [Salmonella enterica]|nr:hypothetical protein [Salmonella enterica]